MIGLAIPLVFVLAIALAVVYALWQQAKRQAFLRETLLPPGLLDSLILPFPDLTLKDRQLVARGLRKFFLAQVRAGKHPVAMPSRVVGALWLAFSRQPTVYARYCRQALGRTLPVTPTVALSQAPETNAALRRCWWHACREENIDPRKPTRLPLLFALDTKLKIRDGVYYFTDDFARRRKVERSDDSGNGSSVSYDSQRSWTPEDLQDPSLDGTTDGFGDSGGDGGGGDGGGGD